MRKLIEKLFVENGYIIQFLSKEESTLFASNTKKSNYYLIVFLNDTDVKELNVNFLNEYFDAIKGLNEGYDPQMDKNLSMLVCVKRQELEPDISLNKKIFDIEEDPYFFKKYVLTYTTRQEEMLLRNVMETDIMTFLHSLLNNEEAFHSHKKFPNHETEYNLVSKLFIKLPFLNLRIRNEELANLKDTINKLLSPELLQLRNNLLDINKLTDHVANGTREEIIDEGILRQRLMEFVGVKINV